MFECVKWEFDSPFVCDVLEGVGASDIRRLRDGVAGTPLLELLVVETEVIVRGKELGGPMSDVRRPF